MKKFIDKQKLAVGCVLLSGLLIGCSSNNLKANKTLLLDKDLSHFDNVYSYGQARFVEGEVLLQSTQNWFFTTKKSYRNFILTAEVLMPNVKEYSNSGIIFRGQIKEGDNGKYVVGYQAEVDPSPRKWTGGFFDQGRRKWLHPVHSNPKRSQRDSDFIKSFIPQWTEKHMSAYKHLDWNSIRIECVESEIKIYINDVLTTHVIDIKDKVGVIGLQHHGSKKLLKTGTTDNVVRFRNVEITELN
ncbi:DUF1080 domain-containing protein [Psychrosphaera sp. 1_MG-2023]|uniref:3-keto-disaccharide hydrolase n=1 Tax=unclassified Psychrosphaera TaxID=2641570 RepID=UPI0020911941|nr:MULTISPECIES: DUF1080 domain-containing protein [unclassified Psychrosphaera]MDO6719832.1 DUF1080 domain-containing protein [Psychrosphaera sp. 1_MG-2023]